MSTKPAVPAPNAKPGPASSTSPGDANESSRELSASSAEVVDELQRLAPNVPRSKFVQVISRQFQGPIPSPDLFKQYAEVIPNAPERILTVFEQDSAHVREMQRNALQAQRDDNRRVHWMAYSLIAGGFLLSIGFALMGKDVLATVVLSTTLVGSIGGLLSSLSNGKRSTKGSDSDTDDPLSRGEGRSKKKAKR